MNTQYVVLCMHKKFIEAAYPKMIQKCQVVYEKNDQTRSTKLLKAIDILLEEIRYEGDTNGLIIENLDHQLIIHFLKGSDHQPVNSDQNAKIKGHDTYIQKAVKYIEENFSNNITIKDVCEFVQISSPYLHKIFVKHIGKTPYQYIMDCKLNKARELLSQTDYSIEEVALKSGFINRSHFSTAFKRKDGRSPLAYRQSFI